MPKVHEFVSSDMTKTSGICSYSNGAAMIVWIIATAFDGFRSISLVLGCGVIKFLLDGEHSGPLKSTIVLARL